MRFVTGGHGGASIAVSILTQAAIGLRQLERLDERNARRAFLAGLYRKGLVGFEHVAALGEAGYEYGHAWHMMVVRVNTDALRVDRDGVIESLRARGIGAGVHFVPLHLQTLYREHGREADLPVATQAHREILTLPLFPDMRDEDSSRSRAQRLPLKLQRRHESRRRRKKRSEGLQRLKLPLKLPLVMRVP